MKLTESQLRNIIRKELKEMAQYWKRGQAPATEKEYDSAQWAGSAGSSVWYDYDKKAFFKVAIVPATEEEYKSAQRGGSAGSSVWPGNKEDQF